MLDAISIWGVATLRGPHDQYSCLFFAKIHIYKDRDKDKYEYEYKMNSNLGGKD